MATQSSDRLLRTILVVSVAALAVAALTRVVRDRQDEDVPDPAVSFEPRWRTAIDSAAAVSLGHSAKVVLVEFVDLECPACRSYHEYIRRAQQEFGDELRVVYVHFPLRTHPHAVDAARASECAKAQGHFDQFLNVVFATQDSIGVRPWSAYAAEAGVSDLSAFSACAARTDTAGAISEGRRRGEELGVAATPTVLLNGWRFRYPPSLDLLLESIRRLRDGRTPRGAGVERFGTGLLAPTRSLDGRTTVITYAGNVFDGLPKLAIAKVAEAVLRASGDQAVDFTGIQTVRPLSRGRLAALDRYNSRVLIFDDRGNFQKVLGRQGDGPGELRTVHDAVVTPGDSIALLDQATRRLTLFALDGGVRTARLPEEVPTKFSQLVGFLSTGEFVTQSVPSIGPPTEGRRGRLPLSVAVLDSSLRHHAVAELPDFEVALQETHFLGNRSLTPTFVRLAPRADVSVKDSLLVAVTGDEYVISLYDLRGQVTRQIRVERPRRKVTQAMKRAQVDRDLDVLHNVMHEPAQVMDEAERAVRAAPYSEWLPAIDGLVESTDGLIWVLEGRAPTDSVWHATGFEPTGAIVRRLEGPIQLTPVLFRVGSVVVRTEDRDGLVGFEVRGFDRIP